MTKIKFCGLRTMNDIKAVNLLLPEYIGFIFAATSKRYISPETAAFLKSQLHPSITAVGVFVQEDPEQIASLLNHNIIHMAQLHGGEDETYIQKLRTMTDRPLIKAFAIDRLETIALAQKSSADYVLLDSGKGGTGTVFDWSLLANIDRPYFLAGGLNSHNIEAALQLAHPYAVDVSSGIEKNGTKDFAKMNRFIQQVKNDVVYKPMHRL